MEKITKIYILEFLPSQEIFKIVSRSNVVGIGNCYCRLTYKNCDNPIELAYILALDNFYTKYHINQRFLNEFQNKKYLNF